MTLPMNQTAKTQFTRLIRLTSLRIEGRQRFPKRVKQKLFNRLKTLLKVGQDEGALVRLKIAKPALRDTAVLVQKTMREV